MSKEKPFDMDEWAKERDAKAILTQEISKQMCAILAPLVDESKSDKVDFPIIIGDLLELADLKNEGQHFPDVAQLYVEWSIDVAVTRKVKPFVNRAAEIYDALVAGGYSEEKGVDYQDLNNEIYYIPSPEPEMSSGHGKPDSSFYIEPRLLNPPKIFVIKTQNFNFLYILNDDFGIGRYEFHIRRFYDVYSERYDAKDEPTKWDLEEQANYAKYGKEWAIRDSRLLEDYADDILGNQYPKRPSLKFFKDSNFKMRFEDSRDLGYVLTFKDFARPDRAVEYAIHNYAMINIAVMQLVGMLNIIRWENEENEEEE